MKSDTTFGPGSSGSVRYTYHNAEGKPLVTVVRGPGKRFWTEPKGVKKPSRGWPLYRAQLLPHPDTINGVVHVESEKTVETHKDAHARLFWTTHKGGGAHWTHADLTALAEHTVVLCPDNDTTGQAWLAPEGLADKLTALDCKVWIVHPPEGAPAHWDIGDEEAEGALALIWAAVPHEPQTRPEPKPAPPRATYTPTNTSGYAKRVLAAVDVIVQRVSLTEGARNDEYNAAVYRAAQLAANLNRAAAHEVHSKVDALGDTLVAHGWDRREAASILKRSWQQGLQHPDTLEDRPAPIRSTAPAPNSVQADITPAAADTKHGLMDDLRDTVEEARGSGLTDQQRDEALEKLDALAHADVLALLAGESEGVRLRRGTLQYIRRILQESVRMPGSEPMSWEEMGACTAREWIIPGWLPKGRVTRLSSHGGGGKTYLALELAAAVCVGSGAETRPILVRSEAAEQDPAREREWGKGLELAPNTAQKTVLYVSWEDERAEFGRRLLGLPTQRAKRLDRYFRPMNMESNGPLWGAQDGGHKDTVATLTAVGRQLEAHIRELQPALVVIDPVAAAFAGNENDRAAVRRWLSHLNALALETGAAILLISHPPKAGGEYSGSTDWDNGVRAAWTLGPETLPGEDKKGRKGLALTLTKANYARRGTRVWLRWEQGRDEDSGGRVLGLTECTAVEAADAHSGLEKGGATDDSDSGSNM